MDLSHVKGGVMLRGFGTLLALTVAATFCFSASVYAQEAVTKGSLKHVREVEQVFLSVALGPSYSVGLGSSSLMTGGLASLAYNYSQQVSTKVFAEVASASGQETTRFFSFGAGADYYPRERRTAGSLWYVTGDLGLGVARTAAAETTVGPAAGGGLGWRVHYQELNWDVSLRYSLVAALSEQGKTPGLASLRGGVNF